MLELPRALLSKCTSVVDFGQHNRKKLLFLKKKKNK